MNKKRTVATIAAAVVALSTAGCASGAEIPAGHETVRSGEAIESPADVSPTGATRAIPETVSIPAPSLADNLVDEPAEQSIQVSLPADYHTSGARYPVVYYLPGFGDSHEVFEEGDSNAMILVGVNGRNRTGGSFYHNSPVTGDWQDFVTKDVVDYVDSTYRTIAAPDGRAVVGHSMGGYGVLNAAMRSDVFAYAYAMSPGVFDTDGLAKSDVDFALLTKFVDFVADRDDAGAREAYLTKIASMGWPADFTFSYASAFAPDAAARAPYVAIPALDAAGGYAHDAAWEMYDAGFGDIPAKLDKYGDNLKGLKGFVIEYGADDMFRFIPEGCDYLSQQLTERGIEHDLVVFEGGHQDRLQSRLDEIVLPYLEDAFGA